VEIHVTDGRTATQRAAERHNSELAVIDLPPVADKLRSLGVAFAAGASAATRDSVIEALSACGWQPQEMRDTPGLWAARTVCMLVNEAADAVHQGVCDEAGADLAMKLGTNWPVGPFEWLGLLGVEYTVTVLDHLFVAYRGERYRVSPLLQQQAWAGRMKTMA
jgi:3-hydroxybutyryl-CoA dehydrogenase